MISLYRQGIFALCEELCNGFLQNGVFEMWSDVGKGPEHEASLVEMAVWNGEGFGRQFLTIEDEDVYVDGSGSPFFLSGSSQPGLYMPTKP
jgi:hypothetical protein